MSLSQFQSSGDPIADRRLEWARGSIAQGDFTAAIDLLTQALELVPGYAAAWFLLGEAREKSGDTDGALDAFRRAHLADPEDRHGAALHVIRLSKTDRSSMSPGYVRALFDGYAPRFDTALTEHLNYVAPEILRRAIDAQHPGRFEAMLDLGCGTGLGGAAFRDVADRMVGVDLSPGMLVQARRKGIYERLEEGEIVSFLAEEATTDARYDLVIAADVFAYFDVIEPVVLASRKVLSKGGLIAFTVESLSDEGSIFLQDTMRYSHGRAYVRDEIELNCEMELLSLERVSTRTEKGVPVPGLVCVARNPK